MRGHGTEQHGVFAFEILTDLDAQTVKEILRPGYLTGSPPGAWRCPAAAPGFRHPNGLRIAKPLGRRPIARSRYPQGIEPRRA